MKRIKLLFILMAFAGYANATVYYVDPNGTGVGGTTWATAFKTLAAAFTGTAAGTSVGQHEVWVKQGTYSLAATVTWRTGINYYGGFVGNESARSQRSTNPALTILDGGGTIRPLASSQLTYATTWDGFTIQNGYNTGGAGGVILQRNAILQNCIVQNCKTTNFGGGGIAIGGGAAETDSIKVLNCIIKNNTVTDNTTSLRGGGGIQIKAGSFRAVVRDCIIEGNISDGLAGTGNIGGAGIHMFDGKVENCTIRNNIATNKNATTSAISYNGKCQGGGILIYPQATANPIEVKNCIISGNSAQTSSGGGICVDAFSAVSTAPVNISKTTVTNNFAYKFGGGVATDRQSASATSSYAFQNCIISNNRAELNNGGGVFINNTAGTSGNVSFTNSNIVNNRMSTFTAGGAGIYYNNIAAVVKNCVIWGNTVYGATPLKHNVRTADVAGNQIVNCALDTRFAASDVNFTVNTTDLTGLVTLELSNTGSESGKLYPSFVAPTTFAGSVISTAADSLLMISNANWALMSTSALIDAGVTVLAITTDIAGVARPQGATSKYDIGAYEYSAGVPTAIENNKLKARIYTANGQIVVDNSGDMQTIRVYNLMGTQLKSIVAQKGLNVISLPAGQLYIVKAGSASQKLML